jgi:tRNA (cmo5U34)-methyltransferase
MSSAFKPRDGAVGHHRCAARSRTDRRGSRRDQPWRRRLLDVGCGAGNYSLKLLHAMPSLDVTLVDLSGPMLERARQRTVAAGAAAVRLLHADIREVELDAAPFDVIVAAAVFHHLRTDDEWRAVFAKLFEALTPGGSLWVFDLVECEIPSLRAATWRRYGGYLESFKGRAYRDHVLAYVENEDTPRPLMYQLDLLRAVGFSAVEVLHKHGCFAAFGAVRASEP